MDATEVAVVTREQKKKKALKAFFLQKDVLLYSSLA